MLDVLNYAVQYVIFYVMGRPKKYDRDDVLKKSLQVFWQRGFADTGLQDLEKATGVNKSGLYAEFKDKEDIFLSSLRYYYASRGGGEILNKEPLGWNNIESFFKFAAKGCLGEQGCLSVCSMRELKILPAEARKMVSKGRVRLRHLFEKNIAAEKTKMPAGALAEIAATFFSGFSIEQNLKTSKASRHRKIEDFMQAVRSM